MCVCYIKKECIKCMCIKVPQTSFKVLLISSSLPPYSITTNVYILMQFRFKNSNDYLAIQLKTIF